MSSDENVDLFSVIAFSTALEMSWPHHVTKEMETKVVFTIWSFFFSREIKLIPQEKAFTLNT